MATKGQSFENPLYADTGGSIASQMSPYAFLSPAASSGTDALQAGLASSPPKAKPVTAISQRIFSLGKLPKHSTITSDKPNFTLTLGK